MTDKQLQVLFLGLGNSRVCWYRVALPGLYLGCDWAGIAGTPPRMQFVTGYVAGATQLPVLDNYDVIVIQEPRGRWFDVIRELKARGKVVLAEYDDYVHGIRKASDHDFAEYFQPKHLKEMELCLRACDGLIASTDYIALRYKRFVPRVYVCENGLDMGRYRLSRPPRGLIDGEETITIMWSGATGHRRGTEPWMEVVHRIMREFPQVCLATIGQDFASQFASEFQQRVIAIPFAALETYPAAMMLGDIALAPAGTSSWYRGKSDLRAMEAAALGIPVVADQHYERSVVDGQSGFIVSHPGQVYGAVKRLVEDRQLRLAMGDYARQHAQANFDMATRREQWREAILDAYKTKHPEEEFIA